MKLPTLAFAFLIVPLSAVAGPLDTLKFGGQIRVRGESRNPGANYAAAGGADAVFLRTRLNLEAEPAKGLKGFLQLQDSRTSGTEASVAANSANVDLKQGYLDIEELWQSPLSLRAGRWPLEYGSQRLISPLDWSNIGRSWDGARLRFDRGTWRADLFATILVESGQTAATDELFSGLWTTYGGLEDHTIDAYVLVKSSDASAQGDLSRHTAGFRLARVNGALKYGAEIVGQWGFQADQTVRAWGAAFDGAYRFDAPYSPQLAGEYAYASGDKNPTDSTDQRFDPLFPFGHFFHGYADLALWSNVQTFKIAVSAKPCRSTWGELAVHHFRLAQGADSWRGANGAVIARDTSATTGKNVGTELDAHFKTTIRGALKLWYGYSHFFRGQYAKKNLTGGGSDMDWAFLQAVLNF